MDPGSLFSKFLAFIWDMRVSVVLATGLALVVLGQAKERRWVRALVGALVILATLGCLPSILGYFEGLSADSFAELSKPNPGEAKFFLGTIASLLQIQPLRKIATLAVAVAVLVALVAVLSAVWKGRRAQRLRWLGSAICAALIVTVLADLAIDYRQSAATIDEIKANYSAPVPIIQGNPRTLHVLVYIGESTGIMDLHLYGYHRQTTPLLDKRRASDPGLLVYDLALSTHTHTGASLMDAFGIPVPADTNALARPIYERRYASVVDALRKAGVDTALVSNQAHHGTWNAGSAAVFAKVDTALSAFDSAALGNNDVPSALRVDDDDFFRRSLPKVWKPGRPQVVFLHSYAGHGPYLQNIPASFDGPVDASFQGRDPRAIVGDIVDGAATVQSVDQYDSAMKYVDFSVNSVVGFSDASPEPTVTIYFSDHGESPWTNRSHDSSRFIHEMLRVPLLVHFNRSARESYPALFARFQDDARKSRPRLLSAMAGTLLNLFDLSMPDHIPSLLDDQRATSASVGEVVRRLDSTTSAIFPLSTLDPTPLRAGWRDDSDIATRLFRLADGRADRDMAADDSPSFCYHRANSMARARRAALVADCVEFDVAPNGSELEVNHPPVAFTGYTLREQFAVLAGSGKGLWIDSKDLGGPAQCQQLATMLEGWPDRPKQILVEFPPSIALTQADTAACLVRLRALGARRSFYVPTEQANACSESVRAGKPNAPECLDLNRTLQKAMASGLLSDLSFDFAGYDAMRQVPGANSLRWDTWGVQANEASVERFKGFGFVIIDVAMDQNFH